MPHITEELWKGLGYDAAVAFIQNTQLTAASTLAEQVPVDTSAAARVIQLAGAHFAGPRSEGAVQFS